MEKERQRLEWGKGVEGESGAGFVGFVMFVIVWADCHIQYICV